jgi:hydroxymethylpyrimidine pyrophosphatase-like HAD family hydrolase
MQKMIIAIDFDGTIVEHKYPEIGKPILFAFETLKQLQKEGHTLILWTYRSGKELYEAIEFCKKNEVEFYAVNTNYPQEPFNEKKLSRKIYADIYIDDRNIGGFLGWSKIWELIGNNSYKISELEKNINKLSIFQKLQSIFSKK